MWEPLSANLAVLLALLVGWTSASEWVARFSATTQKILFGLLMAVGTLASMFMAFEFEPGRYTDLRMAIIAIAGFFGGVPAALLAGGAALLYRVYLGGAFLAGGSFIVLAMVIGFVGYTLRRGKPATLAHVVLLAFALVGATLGLMQVAFPSFVTVTGLWIPSFYTFSATLLLGAVLLLEAQRRELVTINGYYQSMVNALPDCLNIKDLQGRFLAANPATARLMGAATTQDLIGKTDFDFYPKELAQCFREDELTVIQGGESRILEQRGVLPSGVMGHLSTLKAPVIGKAGTVAALITLNRDITQQKRTQTKLEETKTFLDLALKNMNEGLAIYDTDGVLLFCNDRYRTLFPRTAHLRRPGVRFADIIKTGVALGEEVMMNGESVEGYVNRNVSDLRQNGEVLVQLSDGKVYSSRTTVLENGCSLRIISDDTEQQRLQRSLSYQAFHDSLTGLANRAKFNQEFRCRLEEVRAASAELTVMVLDLDRFKEVNDNFGHDTGDKLLIEVAQRLESTIRQGDLAARLGGDEFAVLVSGAGGRSDPANLAERILKSVGHPLSLGDVTLLPGTSIGYTTYPTDNSDQDGLLRHADQALYFAKASGRRTYRSFEEIELGKAMSA